MTITALLLAIAFCGYKLRAISVAYKEETKIKDKVSQYQPDYPVPIESIIIEDDPTDTPVPLPEGDAEISDSDIEQITEHIDVQQPEYENTIINQNIVDLQNEVNADIIGWLTIPDTNIDYPVVLADDNDYYLNRDIYGNQAKGGSLFMDYRCAPNFSAPNTVIYGHNMKNRSMFGDLRKFADSGFFDSNVSGTLYVKDNTYSLDIFAYMVVRADDVIIYDPYAERNIFDEYVGKKARRYRGPQGPGNIVTLSTCAYEFKDARMILLAVINPQFNNTSLSPSTN